MAARALGLGPGKKIIVPAITFLATASAPHMNGAEIVFADVDPATGLMTPETFQEALARAGSADAVFNVHLNGQCGELEEIAAIARANGMKIVDDACHTLGASYVASNGAVSRIGANAHSDLSVFSFHPVKAIAMGEGGAVTTNDSVDGQAPGARAQSRHDARCRRFHEPGCGVRCRRQRQSLVLRTRRAGVQLARQRHPMRAGPVAA